MRWLLRREACTFFGPASADGQAMGHSHWVRLVLEIAWAPARPPWLLAQEGTAGVQFQQLAVQGLGADVGHEDALGTGQQSGVK